MNNSRWEQIKSLFSAAMDLPPAERASFLDQSCGEDKVLRAEIESLLSKRTVDVVRTGGAFSNAPTATSAFAPITERPGTVIGQYKLLQQIGEGGFGTVFLAEQSKPVRRRVALKIIKLGMDTKSVIARFEAERQALALMEHPHIARVLDAGATDTGRPYFVMEYVIGDSITHFSDAHKLNVRQRLELFSQVCQAVQHAHTKGVIHRDIKPGNILVSMSDGKPFAKVIDFGIAKATAAPLTDKTLFTEHRQLIGTPEYMSPEQAEGSADIDTRTDVYALGVLLYELLTGLTPFDGARLRSAAWIEMQRIIREEDPPAPSIRLTRDLNKLAATAAARHALPSNLSTQIKGELDWIVMKALDKDRARRYESPNQLAADVQRHLGGEAVIAAPVSAGYRLRKFVRRNKSPVIMGGIVAVALLAGIAGTIWGWQEAKQQKRLLAEQVSELDQAIRTISTAAENAAQRGGPGIAAQTDPNRLFPGITLNEPDKDPQAGFSFKAGSRVEKLRDEAVWYINYSAETNTKLVQALADADTTLMHAIGSTISGLPSTGADPATAAGHIDMLVGKVAFASGALLVKNEKLLEQTNASEWSAYIANLALAQAAMDAGNYPEARKRLAAAPESKRGWEWVLCNRSSLASSWRVPYTYALGGLSDDNQIVLTAYGVGEHNKIVNDGLVIESNAVATRSFAARLSATGIELVATDAGCSVGDWSAESKAILKTLTRPATDTSRATFTPDAKSLIWCDSGSSREGPWFLLCSVVSEWGGPERNIDEIFVRVSSSESVAHWRVPGLLKLYVDAILADASNGPAGLTITTPDGTRRIVGGTDKTVRFYDTKPVSIPAAAASPSDAPAATPTTDAPPRELAVVRMPSAVTNLQMTGDGTRLIISLADGSARVWDIRDPEERRKDMQAKWAERTPAAAYLDTLWNDVTTAPDGTIAPRIADLKLRDTIIADASLSALRRLVAVELLEERRSELQDVADKAMAALTKDQTDPAAVQAAARAADLPPRVKEIVLANAADWTYPAPGSLIEKELAESKKTVELTQAQLKEKILELEKEVARAELAESDSILLRYTYASEQPSEHQPPIAELRRAVHIRSKHLGDLNPKTIVAMYNLSLYLSESPNQDLVEATSVIERAVKCQEQIAPSPDARLFELWFQAAKLYQQNSRLDLTEAVSTKIAAALQSALDTGSFPNMLVYYMDPSTIQLSSLDQASLTLALEFWSSNHGEVLQFRVKEGLAKRAWSLAMRRDGEQFAPTSDLEQAVVAATQSRDMEPAPVLAYRALSLLHCRLGQFSDAFSEINETIELESRKGKGHHPATLAILAMTHFKLGGKDHLTQARESLTQLRAIMSDPANIETWANDSDAQSLLKEAEALIDPRSLPPTSPPHR